MPTLELTLQRFGAGGGLHMGADSGRAFSQPVAAQFVIIAARRFDMNVDSVKQRPEIRFWYLVTIKWAHVQGFCESS